MAKRRVMLTFPPGFSSEPIVYNIGQQFNIVINIRRAALTEEGGWIEVQLEGEDEDIETGIARAISKGARAEPTSEET